MINFILDNWLYVLAMSALVGLIIFFHLDNLKFCRKLDRIMKGDKNVKL